YHDAREGGNRSEQLWAEEYRLCAQIGRYPKPYVALMDGIVLGGGVGVSAHGSIRVVTDSSRVGMPETTIGFIPDVGGTYLLSRSPGRLGEHVALTGMHLSGSDAIAVGLADYFVPGSRLVALTEALAESQFADPVEIVRSLAVDPPASSLAAQQPWVDECYAADSVSEIVDRLECSTDPAARAAAAELTTKSPTALVATLMSLRSARNLPHLEAVLDQEYRVSLRAFAAPDFAEGIRAKIIDKDRDPRWQPATLDMVEASTVASHFASLGPKELGLADARDPDAVPVG
ncbi:MAG: enoyl-CoA hydratase/isomerase family protein, partial [Hyphomicrobiales bacterium]